MSRHYMAPASSDGLGSGSVPEPVPAPRISDAAGKSFAFDPRYLVFEFVWNIQLRKKQVEIVDDFRSNLANGRSKVKQMVSEVILQIYFVK